MRELVAQYLSHSISRRRFRRRPDQGRPDGNRRSVGPDRGDIGQLRAGRRSAAQPASSGGGARGRAGGERSRRVGRRRREAVPGPRRRRLRRSAHRLRREICVRQFRQRGCAVLRGAGRPAAAQIHPHAARRARRRDGGRLHQGVGRARHRDAGRGRRHGQRHRADVQRLQGADAAGRLLLPHRPDRAAPAATGSRRCPTRNRSSSRSPSTPGSRAEPT